MEGLKTNFSELLANSTVTTLGCTGTGFANATNTTGWVDIRTALTRSNTTTVGQGAGLTLQGNSTINFAPTQIKSMTPKQVHVAVFTITRDADTAEVVSTKFVKELWIEQKNGTSIDLLVAKQLDKDFDPETTVIKVIATVSF